MHFVHPIQTSSSIQVIVVFLSVPLSGLSDFSGSFNNLDNFLINLLPPGGHWLKGVPETIASAYGLQPLNPHWVHWVVGSKSCILSVSFLGDFSGDLLGNLLQVCTFDYIIY